MVSNKDTCFAKSVHDTVLKNMWTVDVTIVISSKLRCFLVDSYYI